MSHLLLPRFISRTPYICGVLLLSVSLLTSSMPVFAQDSTSARLNRMENELQTLSRAVFKGETPPPSAYVDNSASLQANMEVRLSQIEMEIRNLTGMLEQQNYERSQFESTVEQRLNDMERRLSEMEFGMGSTLNNKVPVTDLENSDMVGTTTVIEEDTVVYQTGGSTVDMDDAAQYPSSGQLGTLVQSDTEETVAAPSLIEPTTPTEYYERAFSLLRSKQYDQAEAEFKSFIERYPDHDLSSNAHYWLGESYYVRNDFEKAARVFAEAYQKYPDGTKGPDNLLKLALSLNGLGKKDEACIALGQLEKEYPVGNSPVLARAETERQKLGCQ